MDETTSLPAYALRPGTTNTYWFMGALLTFFATGKETGGQYALFEATVRKGYEVPPHTHSREDESFYMLEGEMECTVGDTTYHIKAGDFLYLPRHRQHSWQALSQPTRFLVWITPAGSEKVFLELSEPAPLLALPPDEPMDEALLARAVALDNEQGIYYAFQAP